LFITLGGPQTNLGDEQRLGPAATVDGTVVPFLCHPEEQLTCLRQVGREMTKLVPSAISKGAPGLAFETWDPSNQFPLETPTLLFVIRSVAEGSAVFSTLPCGPGRELKRSSPGWRSYAVKLSPIHLPAAGNVERIEIMTAETKADRLSIAG
jgi:hypothetical protein